MVPNFSSPFIILIYFIGSITCLASSFTEWTQIPSPQLEVGGQLQGLILTAVTVSDNYLWGIDNRTNSAYPPGNLVTCARPCTGGNWIDGNGALDQIDANSNEVWGTNFQQRLYRRPVSGAKRFTRVRNFGSGCDCSCDISVSNNVTGNGYVWVLSCDNTIMCHICDGSDWTTFPHEISLTRIEAGDEEVWAVNATNHIFKRPVNGSGTWSTVPGEMRYISASGNAHVWGIAPNNSLYVCAKPCTGDWQYVGRSFKQVDGGKNSVVGVTTDDTVLAMSIEDLGMTNFMIIHTML